MWIYLISYSFYLGLNFHSLSLRLWHPLVLCCVLLPYFFQMNLPAPLLPSIDLTYIEDKYSGLSTQALLNVWSNLKGRKAGSSQGQTLNDTKVCAHHDRTVSWHIDTLLGGGGSRNSTMCVRSRSQYRL